MKTIRDLLKPRTSRAVSRAIVVRGDPRLPARCIEATQALAGIGPR